MKKIFGMLLLATLSMSMSNYSIVSDCTEDTFDVMEFADALGFSEDIVTCVGNAFYAECSGYLVNYDDCF